MILTLQLKYIRCFDQGAWTFGPRTLIVGANGTGKTSILEALYYACYHRSFRTARTADLFLHGSPQASIRISGQDSECLPFSLTVGMTNTEKRVTLNDAIVRTYKDLFAHYRVVLLSEHDVHLSMGSPDIRRTYIDQCCALLEPSYTDVMRSYRTILDQRNALLAGSKSILSDEFKVWTDKLCSLSTQIRVARKNTLEVVAKAVQELHHRIPTGQSCPITLSYEPFDAYEQAYQVPTGIFEHELIRKRTRIGAHLDDISIYWNGVLARSCASRGQHKRIALLLKLAQRSCTDNAVTLIDDFVTDLDPVHAQQLYQLCDSLPGQVIMTTPSLEAVSFAQPSTIIHLESAFLNAGMRQPHSIVPENTPI